MSAKAILTSRAQAEVFEIANSPAPNTSRTVQTYPVCFPKTESNIFGLENCISESRAVKWPRTDIATIVAMKKPKKREVPTMQIRISGALFSVALKAARSISAPFREGGQQPALTSIVFSVVALEAFLNEATDIALEYYSDPAISLFVDFMVDAEKSRASLESKFVLSRWILAGQKFDRGSQPYQDFALLLGLRNDLVHFKATEEVPLHLSAEEIHEKLINKFRSKNILSDELFPAAPWTYLIETKAVAGWACKTASRMVVEFYEKMPREKMPQNMWRHFVATLVCAFADIGTIPNRVESWPLSGPDPT